MGVSRTCLVIGILVLAVLAAGAWMLFGRHAKAPEPAPAEPQKVSVPVPSAKGIGSSLEGRSITAYSYGTGPKHLLFVGGMHGGYEWNSVLLAYQFMDYLAAHPETVPASLTIDVIPSINPDGVFKAVGKEGRFSAADASTDSKVLASARFNAHAVDLNRNFDCKWQATSTWQGRPVSAGTSAFSEPESRAVRTVVTEHHPAAVVFWHSQANAVYASECTQGILPGTLASMDAYAHAAGYPAVKTFDAYPITGDAEGWLASIGIPAITVELATHETVEWDRNLLGIQALIDLYK